MAIRTLPYTLEAELVCTLDQSMAACRNELAVSGIVLNVFCVSLPSFLQFFQRTQIQTARTTIPTNTSSKRPGSQTPLAVYPTNQPIMKPRASMPFPSPQAAKVKETH